MTDEDGAEGADEELGRQIRALYFTRFAGSFVLITLLTLLPTFINELGAEGFVYAAFPLVSTPWQFVGVRSVQGIAATASGLTALALVGDLAHESARANTIGKSNSWRFAADIGGSFSAGALYDAFVGILTVNHGRDALAAW